ncbi:tetratricopeptide repeat-containing diguanylate cyclase [Shewanella sp. WPAGA9]|uniref:tetratricopeptide repeat-containing diguanylate cyclase n=1 Tax=Shewanella sp. ENK2 TaxID=2775245 RepID=UPI001786918E|nr:tetratricopeptide repeat-containing diguanylate cyclase [Shewanella sp. WPAGA9]
MKHFLRLPALLMSCLSLLSLLVSITSLANTLEANEFSNPEFDALFTIVDHGDINDERYPQTIEQLTQMITKGDMVRTHKLLPKQCLAFNFFEPEQNEQAASFIINAYENYPEMPHAIRIELSLCEATLLRYRGEINNANELIKQALADAKQIEHLRLIADAYSMLGQIASYTGDFAIALENLLQSYEIYQGLNLPTLEHLGLLDLAITYRRLGETDTALKYYKEVERQFSSTGQTALVMIVKNDMAYAYEDLQQYQKAADNYLSIYNYYQKVHTDPTFVARVAVDMSSALIHLGQYQQALNYLNQYENIVSPAVDTHYSFLQLHQAQAKHGLGQTQAALPHLEKAIAGFDKNNNKRGHEMLLKLQVEIYESLEWWQQAYEAQLALYDIHVLLDKALKNQASTEMRVRFDSQKLEAENAELVAFHQLKDEQLVIRQDNERLQVLALMLGVASVLTLVLFSVFLNKKSKQLKYLALTDLLTQLPNRLSFYRRANSAFDKHIQDKTPLSIISIDIDHFKKVNDNHGHVCGDRVLKAVANIIRKHIKEDDIAGRVGGEEFIILLPKARSQAAVSLAQEISASVNLYQFSNFSDNLEVTISGGVSTSHGETTLSQLIKKADLALYRAKHQGRNQIVYFHDDD